MAPANIHLSVRLAEYTTDVLLFVVGQNQNARTTASPFYTFQFFLLRSPSITQKSPDDLNMITGGDRAIALPPFSVLRAEAQLPLHVECAAERGQIRVQWFRDLNLGFHDEDAKHRLLFGVSKIFRHCQGGVASLQTTPVVSLDDGPHSNLWTNSSGSDGQRVRTPLHTIDIA